MTDGLLGPDAKVARERAGVTELPRAAEVARAAAEAAPDSPGIRVDGPQRNGPVASRARRPGAQGRHVQAAVSEPARILRELDTRTEQEGAIKRGAAHGPAISPPF